MHKLSAFIVAIPYLAATGIVLPAGEETLPVVESSIDTSDYNVLPEYTDDGLKIVDLRHEEHRLDKRAACTGTKGLANGQCVTFYAQTSSACHSAYEIGSYKPTCAGNCYVYENFYAIFANGDGTYGTNCQVFSDTGCKNYMTETGNQILGSGSCKATGADRPWKSMKCFYRC